MLTREQLLYRYQVAKQFARCVLWCLSWAVVLKAKFIWRGINWRAVQRTYLALEMDGFKRGVREALIRGGRCTIRDIDWLIDESHMVDDQ